MNTCRPLFLTVLLIAPQAIFAQSRPAAAPAAAARAPGGARPSGSALSNAQTASQPPADPTRNEFTNPSTPEQSSDPQSGQANNMWALADKILNSDSMSVDSEKGVFQWKNSKFDIGNNLAIASRFVRYLSSPGYPDTALTYQQVLTQIEDLLLKDPNVDTTSPTATADENDRVVKAWQLLGLAAKYPQDGGASDILANQVFNAWRVRGELSKNRAEYEAVIAKEKVKQKDVGRDLAVAKSVDINNKNGASTGKGGNQGPTGSSMNGPKNSNGTAQNQGNSQSNSFSNNNYTDGVTSTANTAVSSSLGGNTGTSDHSASDAGGSSTLPGASGGALQPLTDMITPISGVMSNQVGSLNGVHGPDLVPMASDNQDLARLYAQEALLDADSSTMGLQTKLQYQAQLLAFIAQRRFQHSLLAGQFYEHIFKGSQQRMNIAQEQISKYFNTDNVVPSVNSFEFISHEAIADVNGSMQAVETAYDAGDRWTALQQLQQAFLLGENLPSVQQFDAAKRRVLLNIYREANDLRHMMEIRDFAGSEATVKKLQIDAKDFESAPIISAIKSAEQTSTNYVIAASQAGLAGDADRVTDNLRKAAELWPLNPEITKMSQSMLNRSNLQAVGGSKFDELLAQHNDRAIYEARDEIGIAVFQDPDRAAQLKAILARVGQVDMAIAFADQAMKQNNGYAAWETLAAAADIEPTDPILANAMRKAAPRVANFVSVLDSADRASKAGDYATALNFYLQAQDMYPPSRIAHEAIADLGTKLMAKLNPKGPSAKALTDKQAQENAAKPDALPKPPAEAAAVNKTSSL